MKKSIFCVLTSFLLVSAMSLFAQVKQFNNNISDFNELEIKADFEVTLISGNSSSALFTVDEDLMEYVICRVDKKTLTIGLDEKKIPKEVKSKYKGKNAPTATLKATITTPEHPQSIILSDKSSLYDNMGAGSVKEIKLTATDKSMVKSLELTAPKITLVADKRASINSTISCDVLSLELSGNSNSTVNCKQISKLEISTENASSLVANGDFDLVKVNSNSNSKIIFNGSAKNAEFNCNGGSNVNASNLIVEKADVKMNSICQLLLNVSASLKLQKISGGASLTYSGNPVIEMGSISKSSVTRSGK